MTTSAQATPRVAVIGTGKMGSAIAARLAEEGFDLRLWDRTRARAEALGIGSVADSPLTAASDAQVVISSLTGADAVRSAYLGPNGVLAAGGDKLLIEMSTAGSDLETAIWPAVDKAGDRLVDAPILGAPTLVRNGQAAVLLGGSEPDVAEATSVIGSLGTVRHVGPLGSAARLKLVANSMLADVILAAAELQVAGERAGLAPDDVFWVLERLAPSIGPRRPGLVEGRHEPTLFALRDLRKDLDLAWDLFTRSDAFTPITHGARELVTIAARDAGGLDITAVVDRYRRREQPTGRPQDAGKAMART
jgi:3-hydroxyisobutyrate dehydrogenase-like beta-hydroxyacid dehydrogenase